MMKMKKLAAIFIFLICSLNLVYGQDEFRMGSLYSAYGVGAMRYSASHRTDAMVIPGI